jgi:hypothetical protein
MLTHGLVICNISICYFVLRFAALDPSLVGKGAKAVFRDKEGMMYALCMDCIYCLIHIWPC